MSPRPNTPAERFAKVVENLRGDPGVTPPSEGHESKKRFGSSGLRVNDKIFAMLVKDRLVVKLPKERVDALMESGAGKRFDPGHGRIMKEWISVGHDSKTDWLGLAKEAKEFVAKKA